MTTGLTISITEELVAELEALAYRNHAYVPVKPGAMKALLSERADLRRDAERYRGVRRVAESQGFADVEFDSQTDERIARFDAAQKAKP